MKTPSEPWTTRTMPGTTYQAAQDWAVMQLPSGHGRPALVIGSPPGEARALWAEGWVVTHLDWRAQPPMDGITAVQGDACTLPWTGATFDAITSTCVWCHVGLGRYGDPVRADADLLFLSECRRVMRAEGRLVIMVGPVGPDRPFIQHGDMHRVTTAQAFRVACMATGWRPPVMRIWSEDRRAWSETDRPLGPVQDPAQDYLCVMTRPC